MTDRSMRGFSLVELAVAILLLGMLFAFSIPAFRSLSASYQLRGATENVAAQLRLAREKAIATGVQTPIHVVSTTVYHVHYYPSGPVTTAWTLPRGITFTSTSVGVWPKFRSDGRCDAPAMVVLQNTRGDKDTVTVQLSGLVMTR
jgi:prepilin-type N-terminal cleavage/methylation domain-containing protein